MRKDLIDVVAGLIDKGRLSLTEQVESVKELWNPGEITITLNKKDNDYYCMISISEKDYLKNIS